MLVGHIADQLLNKHGLTHTGAAEQADLAALGIGRQQVHHLDAGFQNLRGGHHIGEGRCAPVNWHPLRHHRPLAVDGITHHIEHTAQGGFTHGHGHGGAGVHGGAAPVNTVGGEQGQAAYRVRSKLLHGLHDHLAVLQLDLDCIVNVRQMSGGKLHIYHGACDPFDNTMFHSRLLSHFCLFQGVGAADDLGDLGSDGGLAHTVELQAQVCYQLGGGVGGRAHGCHS